jgi:putative tricarboxylic transport membrane protein
MRIDRYIGLCLLAFCFITYFILIPNQIEVDDLGLVGPRFFPQYITIGLAVLGVLLTAFGWNKPKPVRTEKQFQKATFLVMLLAFVYVAAINYLGYVVPSILALICLMKLYGEKITLKLGLVSIAVVLVLYVFFARVMNLMMPKGLLSPLFEALIY